jgi:hypothetical protein
MRTTKSAGLSRRALLGGSAAGAATLALNACGPDPTDAVAAGDIFVARVRRVPESDPRHEDWGLGPEKRVLMGPQPIALPNRATPSVAEIKVRSVHDGQRIGFRLEWTDVSVDDLTVRVDDYRDACAVLLAPGAGDPVMRTMGSPTQPAVLLHWKADWERDMALGIQGMAAVYPNRCVDTYPPLTGQAPADVTPATYVAAGATAWLPGLNAGNPLSSVRRTTPVEKLIAHGFGTASTATSQDAFGHGERNGDRWSVVITKPLVPGGDPSELALQPGAVATCAFAVWSGREGDAGSRKSPSADVYRLVLEA